jgi:hypothetical protein
MRKLAGNPIHTLRDKRFHRDILYGMMFALFLRHCVHCRVLCDPIIGGAGYLHLSCDGCAFVSVFYREGSHPFFTYQPSHDDSLILVSDTVLITTCGILFTAFATPVGPGRSLGADNLHSFFVIGAVIVNRVFFRKAIVCRIDRRCDCRIWLCRLSSCCGDYGIWHPTC